MISRAVKRAWNQFVTGSSSRVHVEICCDKARHRSGAVKRFMAYLCSLLGVEVEFIEHHNTDYAVPLSGRPDIVNCNCGHGGCDRPRNAHDRFRQDQNRRFQQGGPACMEVLFERLMETHMPNRLRPSVQRMINRVNLPGPEPTLASGSAAVPAAESVERGIGSITSAEGLSPTDAGSF